MSKATLKQVKKALEQLGDIDSNQLDRILGSGILPDLRDGDLTRFSRNAFRPMVDLPPIDGGGGLYIESRLGLFLEAPRVLEDNEFLVETDDAEFFRKRLPDLVESQHLDLAIVSLENLGCGTMTSYETICRRAIKGGLALCPPMAAVAMSRWRGNAFRFVVGMSPMPNDDGLLPAVFVFRQAEPLAFDRDVFAAPATVMDVVYIHDVPQRWNKDQRFAFMIPDKS